MLVCVCVCPCLCVCVWTMKHDDRLHQPIRGRRGQRGAKHTRNLWTVQNKLCIKPHVYDDTVVQQKRKDLPLRGDRRGNSLEDGHNQEKVAEPEPPQGLWVVAEALVSPQPEVPHSTGKRTPPPPPKKNLLWGLHILLLTFDPAAVILKGPSLS